jgi:hypothetical protein
MYSKGFSTEKQSLQRYTFAKNLFPILNNKVIRDKNTGYTYLYVPFHHQRNLAGYCFIDFGNAFAASKYQQTLNGTTIPGTNKCFKLNFSNSGSGVGTVNAEYFFYNTTVIKK